MPNPIIALSRFLAIIKPDGTMFDRLIEWMEKVTRQVNDLQTIEGTGSPEGVTTGSNGQYYFDTAADTLYYKKTGDGNTGWIAL